MEPLQVVNSVDDGPYAVRTILGWTVNGPLRGGSGTMETNRLTEVFANRISVAKLEELWQLQFKQDFPDAGQDEDIEMSKDDHKFVNTVCQSAKLSDGHYSVCLPVRNKSLCMPNNRSVAAQRALNLRKRFSKDAKFYAEYVAFMDDILKKGHAVKLDSTEQEPTEGRTWYLPHHGVRHPVKQKLRVVFDCGASFGGTSLNQQLLQGPDLTSSLVGVLMRFRQETVAVMADVEAMFYQVRVSNEDTDLLRFLWWPDGNYEQELVEHKMLVHIFGATSSPSVATFALQKCATDFEEEFCQEAARTVKKKFYVDDCLKSTTDEDTAIALCADLRNMLAKGGFRLTKWSSNSRKLLNSIPEEEKARVAPLKSPTIPRMELTAATVAIKMDKLLEIELELELHDSIFWTDSTAVLKYLNSESTRFKTFWKRWCREYLMQLQERQRWFTPGRNFCVGDVVLIVDDTSPRNSWPL
ncbi:hypothetical protein PBY51_020583 [Eleginops maclovinus]|uniref:DUF5641 domain-containing protein n=1 Tax=Eleginops maclovinus TaxID=56733 RepID=A0AAN7XTZ5_ELEMC|nr:hypothetical protein PBY51_020583 [Eleginops maclovinus]